MPDSEPVQTCIKETCDGCAMSERLHCHFTGKDLLKFYLAGCPSFIIGGVGIYLADGLWLIPWIAICLGFFGFLEIRVICSHCPHYAEKGLFLTCWANYGAPKIWKYRPAPVSKTERFLFFSGMITVWAYPLVFLVLYLQWILLVLYLGSIAVFFVYLFTFMCPFCAHFLCPFNRVPVEVRQEFSALNPHVP